MRRPARRTAALAAAVALWPAAHPAAQALRSLPVPKLHWSFEGPFGTFDIASAQRGYAVYSQVCAACHSMKQVVFRDLTGLGFDADQLHQIASAQAVRGGFDASGDVVLRAANPGDHFPAPYANDEAARAANGGAVPPDQSRIAATVPGGASFIEAFLTGYRDTPPDVTLPAGMHYNLYVPFYASAMPPPLHDGQVRYADGTRATTAQMAHDVSTFLAWVAQPHLEARRRMGVRVLVYLALLLGLVVVFKRKVWADAGR